MSRTRLPMLLGAVLVFLFGVAPGPVWAQRPPIKIGFMTDLTGTAAQAAKDMVNGLTMYLDEIGYQMAGRKVELIVEDSQSRPDVAITKLRKLVEHDRVHVLAGLGSTTPRRSSSSPCTAAMSRPAATAEGGRSETLVPSG